MTTRSLKINIIEGKDLKGLDAGGVSDAFVKFKCGQLSAKTDVVKKSTSPIWNYFINVGNVEESTILNFDCFDWERIGSDRPIGKVQINVLDLSAGAKRNINDQWLRLDTKGFIRVSYEFTPPYPLETEPISNDPNSPTAAAYQSMNNLGMLAPPVVYFKPIFLPTIPMESISTLNSLTTTCKFLMPGTVYQTRPFICGELMNCSLVINVYEPRIVVRALNLTLSGAVVYKGKKQRTLVNDYRDLLLGYGNEVTQQHSMGKSCKIVLERGKHVFPFQFFIDKTCKSSIKLNNYSVFYNLLFSADIVNQPDIQLNQEIKVVNLEDTVYKMTTSPVSNQTSKSPLTGGNISIACKSVKNSFYPGEEIELEVDVNNTSKKKVKAVDIQLMRVEYDGTDITGVTSQILTMNKRFYPKVKPNTKGKMMVVVELPTNSNTLTQSISESKMIRIEYYLNVNLDILNCVDLRMKLPIIIVQPDPKLEILPNPLTEIGTLPRYIKDWTVRNFYSWVVFKKQCPEVIHANPEFYQYDLNGVELMQLPTETLFNIFKGAGSRTNEMVLDLQSQISEIQFVRNFLKELQLSNLIAQFEKQSITWEILPLLSYHDIRMIGDISIGDCKRIEKKINEFKNSNMFVTLEK